MVDVGVQRACLRLHEWQPMACLECVRDEVKAASYDDDDGKGDLTLPEDGLLCWGLIVLCCGMGASKYVKQIEAKSKPPTPGPQAQT